MSFIQEVNNARSEGFKKSVKEKFVVRQKELQEEQVEFHSIINETINKIDEIKSDILNAAEKDAHSYIILENFNWVKSPYFRGSVDFDGAELNTPDLLTGDPSLFGFNSEWHKTYRQFVRETITDKLFLNLWEQLESLGLEPFVKNNGFKNQFGVKF
ncbi:hypothetical protein Q4506_17950 [Colwellia sp. 4_MG-2023]|uniref:hypothetical protein n=1 Tax=unclassified Colwellia TaxID=196834 RepID=UPI0026E412E9|nr:MULTISPECIES: hypothetical protein [unclassified Colwellia]MDO6508863.1 hypothetical protein [Colwellia sp. 5_MG-2023]MDO6557548.1 hypothetical protein [Colwellia sp. 4_MG-2023]